MPILLRILISFGLLLPSPMLQHSMFFGQNVTASSGGLSYTFVNSASFACASFTCTESYSPVAGDQVFIVGQVGASGAGAMTSVLDNASGGSTTYTADFNDTTLRGNNNTFIYRTCNVKAGATTFTTLNSNATSGETTIIVLEFHGGSSSGCLDQVGTGLAVTTNTSLLCCTLTPTVNNELSIGVAFSPNSITYAGSSGYTCFDQFNGAFSDATAGCYKILSGMAAQTLTATWDASNVPNLANQALYK